MGIISDAYNLIGKVKYSFGANDIEGGAGDCSAFTQYVFNKNGYTIGRSTREQINHGTPVEYKDLQPGDLVFFQGTYREGVSHVGIYTGGGKMVNLESDGVVIDDITTGYWNKHYMTARRVANSEDVGGANDGATTDFVPYSPVGLTWWGDVVKVVFCVVAALLKRLKVKSWEQFPVLGTWEKSLTKSQKARVNNGANME